jgi:hypothetical protein
MATYTDINGVKLITTGDEAGTWGSSTNTNLEIIERAANGFAQIALTGTSYTLTLSNQPSAAENGHYKAIEFTGTPGGTCTVTLAQNDHARVYMFLNSTNQTVSVTQGSGSNVTIAASEGAVVLADGAGSGAAVKDLVVKAGSYVAGSIVNADINASAAIADTKLDTISTSSKVSNSATTATNANTASAIVARDGSGNFSAGTITATLTGNASSATTAAALTGDVTKSGSFTVDASGDINLDADGGDIVLKDGGTTRGSFDIGTASTVKIKAGTTEELRVTTSGLNVLNGLRVGDTTAPTDNDLHVVSDITLGGALTATGNVTGDHMYVGDAISLTSYSTNWKIDVDGSGNLLFIYGSTTRMKLDASGNLSVEGNVTAYASL